MKLKFPASPCNKCGTYNKPIKKQTVNNDIKYHYTCKCGFQYKRSHNSMISFRKLCSRKAKEYWASVKHKENNTEDVYSSTEKIMKDILDQLGIKYIHNYLLLTPREGKIRRYRIDFYLPDYKIGIECDGSVWHNLWGVKEKDQLRDQAIFNEFGIKIYRYSDIDLRRKNNVKEKIMKILAVNINS